MSDVCLLIPHRRLRLATELSGLKRRQRPDQAELWICHYNQFRHRAFCLERGVGWGVTRFEAAPFAYCMSRNMLDTQSVSHISSRLNYRQLPSAWHKTSAVKDWWLIADAWICAGVVGHTLPLPLITKRSRWQWNVFVSGCFKVRLLRH